MLLTFCLLLCMSSANSQTTKPPGSAPAANPTTAPLGTCALVATPDFPVAAGQEVHLHCSVETSTARLYWQRLGNGTWEVVSNGSDLTLSKPQESGLYRCVAEHTTMCLSQSHTVFIVAIPPTAIGTPVAALVFSLLALAVSVAVVFWQRRNVARPVSNPANGPPAPEKAPKVKALQAEGDGDVYVNYTSSGYTDLDPTSVSVASVYSTLS